LEGTNLFSNYLIGSGFVRNSYRSDLPQKFTQEGTVDFTELARKRQNEL